MHMRSSIEIWVDEVNDQARSRCAPTERARFLFDDLKENAFSIGQAKKRTWRDTATGQEMDETPRPRKRHRDNVSNADVSLTGSDADTSSEVGSYRSGRSSPVKQLEAMRDADEPILFCTFDDPGYPEPQSIAVLRDDLEDIGRGVGIMHFAYQGSDAKHFLGNGGSGSVVSRRDEIEFGRAHVWDEKGRLNHGTTPSLDAVAAIVGSAQRLSDQDEDTWNHDVHRRMIDLALTTSTHREKLEVHSVKTAKIDPPTLSQHASLPRRVVDYAITLRTPELHQAWRTLRPLVGTLVKSWNHTTLSHVREMPIAINIETKAPSRSWTEAKPQLAIWMNAWLRRLELLDNASPHSLTANLAVPVLIVQGHDWYALTMEKHGRTIIFREKIEVGNTRSIFGGYKTLAALQYLANWAETVWRPWFTKLVERA